ncbi:MAG: hypothetical protein ACI9MR_002361, partial [Myxococcota bacterium]
KRIPRRLLFLSGLLIVTSVAGCTDDPVTTEDTSDTTSDTSDTGDTNVVVLPDGIFAFGVDPAQTISAAPFPNDLYLTEAGIALAPLASDPTFGNMASERVMTRLDGQIADRTAFGTTSAAFFPMTAEPDLSTFEDRVRFVSVSGFDLGRVLKGQVAWRTFNQALVVLPVWGEYLEPGSQYAVLIEDGVTDVAGTVIEAPTAFSAMLDATAPTDSDQAAAYVKWAPVRAALAADDTLPTSVVGTLYTTENPLAYAQALLDSVDGEALEAPTLSARWDTNGAAVASTPLTGDALAGYFGLASAPFANRPGVWGAGSRADAAAFTDDSAPYTGGAFSAGIDGVYNGSFTAPAYNAARTDGVLSNKAITWENGVAVATARHAVPFTLFLCGGQLESPADLPVAIMTHGGSAQRTDAVAYAAFNCTLGVATIAADLPFHSGRGERQYIEAEDLIVPVGADTFNSFTGLSEGDTDYVSDQVGDAAAVTSTVGGLFAIPSSFDPLVMEANLLQIAVETQMLTRLLRDGSWGQVLAGLSFDGDKMFHQSLSFGTTFTTVLHAVRDNYLGIIQSVGTGRVLSANLATAPNNADLAAPILSATLGLESFGPELALGAWRDPAVALVQWLSERGDGLPYAPFVMRRRADNAALAIISSGNSWDETVFSPAQLSFDRAMGYTVYTAGADWTIDPSIPGSELLEPTVFTAPVSGNQDVLDPPHVSAIFYSAKACHAQVITPMCRQSFAPPQPASERRDTPVTFLSPICGLQSAMVPFMTDLMGATSIATIAAPTGTCDDVYGR